MKLNKPFNFQLHYSKSVNDLLFLKYKPYLLKRCERAGNVTICPHAARHLHDVRRRSKLINITIL